MPFEFQIRATGEPAPKITKTGWLPSYMSLIENADGTATLRGLWKGPAVDICLTLTSPCYQPTVTATNRNQAVGQMLDLRHFLAPAAEFTGPSDVEFLAGAPGQFVLTTRGAQTHISWEYLRTQLSKLSWLRFIEGSDGSLTLSRHATPRYPADDAGPVRVSSPPNSPALPLLGMEISGCT